MFGSFGSIRLCSVRFGSRLGFVAVRFGSEPSDSCFISSNPLRSNGYRGSLFAVVVADDGFQRSVAARQRDRFDEPHLISTSPRHVFMVQAAGAFGSLSCFSTATGRRKRVGGGGEGAKAMMAPNGCGQDVLRDFHFASCAWGGAWTQTQRSPE